MPRLNHRRSAPEIKESPGGGAVAAPAAGRTARQRNQDTHSIQVGPPAAHFAANFSGTKLEEIVRSLLCGTEQLDDKVMHGTKLVRV